MRRAIELAKGNILSGKGGPFGALIVKNGKIISEASNLVTSSNDPTAHAEVMAIRKACQVLNTFVLDGCEIYTSCEPCPMCLGAIYWARISKIYFASSREDAAEAGFDDSFIYDEVKAPHPERKLPLQNLLTEEGNAVFCDWLNKLDRINY